MDFDQPTGPRIELEEHMKPVDFFQLYFTDVLWNHIVDQTNLYAEQKRGPKEQSVWYALTVNELKAWIALTLNMGIVKNHLYTTTGVQKEIFKTPFFSAVMSRDRYFQIMRYLHFVDNQEEVKDKNSPNYDKLFKVRKLLDLLLPRFLEVYNPERNLSIDETLITFKGKIYFRQFICIKPGRFGINCFTLAETSSASMDLSAKYTLGKKMQWDLGRRSVMGLMEAFFDKGYKLYQSHCSKTLRGIAH